MSTCICSELVIAYTHTPPAICLLHPSPLLSPPHPPLSLPGRGRYSHRCRCFRRTSTQQVCVYVLEERLSNMYISFWLISQIFSLADADTNTAHSHEKIKRNLFFCPPAPHPPSVPLSPPSSSPTLILPSCSSPSLASHFLPLPQPSPALPCSLFFLLLLYLSCIFVWGSCLFVSGFVSLCRNLCVC